MRKLPLNPTSKASPVSIRTARMEDSPPIPVVATRMATAKTPTIHKTAMAATAQTMTCKAAKTRTMEVALDPTAGAEPTLVEAALGLAAAAGMMVVMVAGMVVEATNNAT